MCEFGYKLQAIFPEPVSRSVECAVFQAESLERRRQDAGWTGEMVDGESQWRNAITAMVIVEALRDWLDEKDLKRHTQSAQVVGEQN